MDELKSSGKPFEISKREVWEAYRQVRANQGAPGVDGVTLDEFEADLKNNLYRIWNRMSSGSYFPPPVKAVEIPKPHGAGTRLLGVPTVADRIAQTVVARRLEAKVEPIFHPDSYGYRPNRSALDAVAACRQRCWKTDWVIDLDVERFFDSVPWELVVKAVAAHTTDPWVVLYVKRWLAAPLALADGSLQQRDRGTPQGSAVSPVLANLFLHYAFDAWMAREHPTVRFERYADDVVVHCVSEAPGQAPGGGDREQDGRGRAAVEPGQDPDRVLQGRQRRGSTTSTPPSPSWGSRSAPAGAREERSQLHRLPARGQQGRPEQDEQGSPPLAAAPAHRARACRARTKDQPDRARLDAVLRRLLPNSAGSPPGPHQRLPDALDPQEVSTAAPFQEGPGLLATHHPPATTAVCPLGMEGHTLVTKTTRAR